MNKVDALENAEFEAQEKEKATQRRVAAAKAARAAEQAAEVDPPRRDLQLNAVSR